MAGRAKLTEEQVKKIRRRVRAGERLTDLAVEYAVNRKTLRRRLDELEFADGERLRRTAARRAGEKRMKRLLGPDYRNPDRAPEYRRGERPDAPAPAARPQPSAAGFVSGGVPFFPSTAEGQAARLVYYEAHKLDHLPHSLLDYNDVLRGLETPAERRAHTTRIRIAPRDERARTGPTTRRPTLSQFRQTTTPTRRRFRWLPLFAAKLPLFCRLNHTPWKAKHGSTTSLTNASPRLRLPLLSSNERRYCSTRSGPARTPQWSRTTPSQLRPRPTPPSRPRRQPPAQLRPLPHRDHPSALPPRSARLPRTQASRRQKPARSDPLPQTDPRPRRLQHPESEPRLDIDDM